VETGQAWKKEAVNVADRSPETSNTPIVARREGMTTASTGTCEGKVAKARTDHESQGFAIEERRFQSTISEAHEDAVDDTASLTGLQEPSIWEARRLVLNPNKSLNSKERNRSLRVFVRQIDIHEIMHSFLHCVNACCHQPLANP